MKNDVIFERLRKHGIAKYEFAARMWVWAIDGKPISISEAIAANELLNDRVKQNNFKAIQPKRFKNKVRGLNRAKNDMLYAHEAKEHNGSVYIYASPADYNKRLAKRFQALREKANH